jgi:dimethylglycine dehydrogenase
MLNEQGGIVGDFTVARVGNNEFYLTGSGVAERINFRWWEQFLPDKGVVVESATTRTAAFSISGPSARELLSRLVNEDVSNEALPFLRCRRLEVGPARDALVLRLSYTGELGYEIHFPIEHQLALYGAITSAGSDLGLVHVGSRALNSLRIEKSFAGWLRELSPEVHPYQCGMGRFVKLDKENFVGRSAALRLRQAPIETELCTFVIDTNDVDPWGGEPILCEDKLAGYVSSASYGHTVGKSLALGYLRQEYLQNGKPLQVEILGEPFGIHRIAGIIYDPRGDRLRS